jgi:hypothetical protein
MSVVRWHLATSVVALDTKGPWALYGGSMMLSCRAQNGNITHVASHTHQTITHLARAPSPASVYTAFFSRITPEGT